MVDVIKYWSVFFLILGFSFIPGYSIAQFSKELNIYEKFSVSFGISFLILVAFTPLITFVSLKIFQVSMWSIVIVSIILLIRHQFFKCRIRDVNLYILILILLAGLFVKVLAQIGWEYPIQGGDWFVHAYEIPLKFQNGDWIPKHPRPQFFNLLILSFHSILGSSLYNFWISQIISTVANSIFILPAYIIAKQLFGKKVAFMSIIFMSLNLFLFYQSIYPWPKNLSSYFILLMLYFLFLKFGDINSYILAGIFAGLGYLAHPMALFFIVPSFLVLTINHGIFQPRQYLFIIFLGILVLPYFLWMYFHTESISSKMAYYPFVVEYDYKHLNKMTHNDIMTKFWEAPWWNIIYIRIYNFVSTLTELLARHNVWNFFNNLPSALTFPVYILSFIGVVKTYRKKTSGVVLINIIALSFIFLVLFFGWRLPGIIGPGGQNPSIIILVIIGFYSLFEIKDNFIRRIGMAGIFSYALLQLIARPYYVIKWFNEGERNLLINSIGRNWHYVEGFDFSKFISAHYFVNTKFEILLSLFVSVLFISISILLFFWSDRSVLSKINKL